MLGAVDVGCLEVLASAFKQQADKIDDHTSIHDRLIQAPPIRDIGTYKADPLHQQVSGALGMAAGDRHCVSLVGGQAH